MRNSARMHIAKYWTQARVSEIVVMTDDWEIQKISIITADDTYHGLLPPEVELPEEFVDQFAVVYNVDLDKFIKNDIEIPSMHLLSLPGAKTTRGPFIRK